MIRKGRDRKHESTLKKKKVGRPFQMPMGQTKAFIYLIPGHSQQPPIKTNKTAPLYAGEDTRLSALSILGINATCVVRNAITFD